MLEIWQGHDLEKDLDQSLDQDQDQDPAQFQDQDQDQDQDRDLDIVQAVDFTSAFILRRKFISIQ